MSWMAMHYRRVEPGGISYGEAYHYERISDGVAVGTESGVLGDVFGFCGCGDNGAALLLMRDAMRLIDRPYPGFPEGPDSAACRKWFDEQRASELALFGPNSGVRYLVWYVLDEKGLTEHGGSVPGWLTDKGKAVLADLEALFPILP